MNSTTRGSADSSRNRRSPSFSKAIGFTSRSCCSSWSPWHPRISSCNSSIHETMALWSPLHLSLPHPSYQLVVVPTTVHTFERQAERPGRLWGPHPSRRGDGRFDGARRANFCIASSIFASCDAVRVARDGIRTLHSCASRRAPSAVRPRRRFGRRLHRKWQDVVVSGACCRAIGVLDGETRERRGTSATESCGGASDERTGPTSAWRGGEAVGLGGARSQNFVVGGWWKHQTCRWREKSDGRRLESTRAGGYTGKAG